jgi:hypothetical protein
MVAHAQRHHQHGYPLPTKWLGAADTFASHVAKTHESLLAPGWRGTWQLKGDGHVAVFAVAGSELVHLRLFGVEDQSGMDRLRAECHGLWFEEPAPSSVLVQSSGLSESAWGLGMTSQRLPSYCHPAIMTLNYPDEDHWTWQRFVAKGRPGDAQLDTAYFRIPPGELASAEARAEWERALANRPDMLRRLLRGQPGTVVLGPQVAVGFNRDTHVRHVQPAGGFPVWLGQDGGHTPTAVMGQRVDGRVRIIGALTCADWGMEQFVEQLLRPWLSEHTPWCLGEPDMLRFIYDPSIDKGSEADINANALHVLRREFRGASFRQGPVSWDDRRDALLPVLNDMLVGEPVLQIDPVQAKGLVRALDTGWYYAQAADGSLKRGDTKGDSVQPKKPNHPHEDFGDAFCYLLAGMAPSKPMRPANYRAQPAVNVGFSPLTYQKRSAVGVGFRPIR